MSLLFVLGHQSLWAQTEGQIMMNWVRSIEGRSAEGRRSSITSWLDSLGVPYTLMSFDTAISHRGKAQAVSGTNIIVHIGTGVPTVVVGAHFDAVANSPGANDNGGGIAVVLMLIADARSRTWKGGLEFVFFDQEEIGLVGSAVYVQRSVRRARHRAMINLDVVGTGEVVYIGPVGGGDDDRVMRSIRRAARTTNLPIDERERYPASDHLSFARADLENISLSVMPVRVVDRLDAMISGFAREQDTLPEVLSVMHTPRDSSTRMSGQALSLVYTLVKGTLLDLDVSDR